MERSSVVDQVLRLREAGKVERCHTLPIAGRHGYTVGQHCFDMLALLTVLHPNPSTNLFRAVMLHDAHERFTGDIPGALKYLSPELAAVMDEMKAKVDQKVGYAGAMNLLTIDEKKWLKALDRIEFFLWCSDQVAMGNQHVGGRLTAVNDQLCDTPMPQPCSLFLQDYRWHRTGDNDVK